jgi:phosphohistidine phosphatase
VTDRQLFLLRHAKSSWDEPGLADHDRPLAKRGRKAAKAMGAHLRRCGIAPALVLCSSARRARQTVDLLGLDGELLVEPGLYEASTSGLLERLRGIPDDVGAAMLVGHQPALGDLALALAREGAGRERAREHFPTGALATLRFTGPWSELAPGDAELVELVRPRELGER